MPPKFRGDSDDWYDDETSKRRTQARPKKEIRARSTDLPWEQANAVVVEVFSKQCRVRVLETGAEFLCSYRWAQLLGKGGTDVRGRTPVAVGDRVNALQSSPDAGTVEGLCSRRNSLSRVAPGRDNQSLHHVVAANIDEVVIVASVREPEFSPGLVDRYLVATAAAGIPASLCLTKVDLPLSSEAASMIRLYREIGTPIYEISAKTNAGIAEVRAALSDKEVVFCGHSGVGKTSLLNVLIGQDRKTGVVSTITGKGKHTTSSAIMVPGQFWIDTPGVREFSLIDIPPADLHRYFPELSNLACTRERSCVHVGEVDCDAVNLPRYSSYRRIHESLVEAAAKSEEQK